MPFEVLGMDFAGPIAYKLSPKKEGKAYILLFSCKPFILGYHQIKWLKKSLEASSGSLQGREDPEKSTQIMKAALQQQQSG